MGAVVVMMEVGILACLSSFSVDRSSRQERINPELALKHPQESPEVAHVPNSPYLPNLSTFSSAKGQLLVNALSQHFQRVHYV